MHHVGILALLLALPVGVSACGGGGSGGSPAPSPGGGGLGGAGPQAGGTGGASATGGASGTGGGSGTGGAGTGGTGGAGTGGTGGSACVPAPAGPLPPLRATEVATGLADPVFVGSAPGDGSRLYVLEQAGRVRVLRDGALLPDAFLDIVAITSSGGERGLLGLAFHPNYAQNGRFFIDYTDSAGDTVIAEYERSANPDVAGQEPVKVLLRIDQPFANHNGGGLAFGPDGMLYIGMGDGGSSGDPQDNGQSLDTELGKLLRIDVDTYPTPAPGNLASGNPHIWDYGLRNPWRFAFDRCTGDLYIADVGQNQWEEINVEPAGQGHKNYGWDVMEGTHCFEPKNDCDRTGLTLPVAEYSHDLGCSVTGGFVYRGKKIPGLAGTYLYGDYCSGRIWSLAWSAGTLSRQQEISADLFGGTKPTISSFGEDASGELYVVDHGGSVYRIEPE